MSKFKEYGLKFWEFIDGKKTITGVGSILLGLAAAQSGFFLPVSEPLIYFGLATFGIGASHKIVKKAQEKKEENNASKVSPPENL